MKTTAHYKCTALFTADDLFTEFWNKVKLDRFGSNPKKVLAKKRPVSIEMKMHRLYLVEAHFCGTFHYLLKPFNTPLNDKIDQGFITEVKEDSTGYISNNYYTAEEELLPILKDAEAGTNFEKVENIEFDENKFIEQLKKCLEWMASTESYNISSDGQRCEGDFTFKRVIAFDCPIASLKYDAESRYDKGKYYTEQVSLIYPHDKPGELVLDKGYYSTGFFNKRKFPKVLEGFKKEYYRLLSESTK
ncbi:MAG: hypothetical protein J6Y74_04165 [Clostridia bacterium]|nr:hypothetical protein [Clostridia bacterium]